MTVDNRNDAILVKIISINSDGKEEMVSSYYTTAINQTLKSFITARDYDIECTFNDFSSVVDEKYKDITHHIQDVYMGFGSREDMPVIEVVIL